MGFTRTTKLLRAGLGLVLLLGVISATILLVWRMQGKQVMTVQTGSMRPVLQKGDAVLVDTKIKNFKLGQIISYQHPAHPDVVVTHRLRRIDKKTGWLQVQGDALGHADPLFPPRLALGRADAVLPGFGKVLNLFHSPVCLVGVIYIPALLVVISETRRLARIWNTPHYELQKA